MDVNELKPASYKARSSIDQVPAEVEQREKRVTSTVPSVEKKDSIIHKFLKSFFQTDAETIKNSIIDDYIVPGIKDAILGAIDMFFYKDGSGRSPRGSSKGPYISYEKHYKGNTALKPFRGGSTRVAEPQERQHRFDYRDLCWPSRGTAEAALRLLWDILDTYHVVSIADLFDIAEVTPPGDSTGNDYGWRDLSGAEVARTWDGQYVIKLPKAVSLK